VTNIKTLVNYPKIVPWNTFQDFTHRKREIFLVERWNNIKKNCQYVRINGLMKPTNECGVVINVKLASGGG
jgi:hypothetical protein